jgi:hypothetical protein
MSVSLLFQAGVTRPRDRAGYCLRDHDREPRSKKKADAVGVGGNKARELDDAINSRAQLPRRD